MHLYPLGYIIVTVFLDSVKVHGVLSSDCPKACECDPGKRTVNCTYGFWNELPNLPTGTTYTRISGGNFSVLKKPHACGTYKDLAFLELKENGIKAVTEDAFRCMPALESLIFVQNNMLDAAVPSGTFNHVPNLYTISLTFKNARAYNFSNLCKLEKLKKIDLYDNGILISSKFLQCFGSLTQLSEVNFGLNTRDGILSEVVQPLQNVTDRVSLKNFGINNFGIDDFKGFKTKILDLSNNSILGNVHIFAYMPNLEELNLSHNRLTILISEIFRAMPRLKKVILTGCNLYGMKDFLPELPIEVVDLSSNELIKIPSLSAKVRQVNLSGNRFYILRNRNFSNLPSLMELNLSNAYISNIEQNSFYNLSNLQLLDLQGNRIKENHLTNLLLDLIVHSPSLETLILSQNPLQRLSEAFAIFKPNHLKKLNLARCKIDHILTGGTFENFPDLQELDLSHNNLWFLTDRVFTNLLSLRILNLNNNSIGDSAGDTFRNLRNLSTLILSNNDFSSEFDTDLSNSPLRELNLQNNSIEIIKLANFSTLENLDLSHNKFASIKELTFVNLSSLRHLDLSSNQIATVKQPTLHKLRDFDLPSHNGQSVLPGLLAGMQNMQTLNLSQTSIGMLKQWQQKKLWENLHGLRSLHVRKAKIVSLFPGMFSTLTNLKRLDASSNDIYHIEPSTFKNTSRLMELYLDNNRITTVNWKSFQYLLHLRILSLTNNPLLCTCEVLWIFQAVRTPHSVYMNNPDDVLCFSPEEVIDTKVGDLDLKASDCEDQWSHIMKPIGIGFSVILTLTLMYITWHYRWHIRYTLFLARAGLGRYKEFHDDTEYVNDAFVAYSEKDLPWVKENLLPNIDKTYIGEDGFKLCLHHRDWLVGVDIGENIVKSIVESRRTVVILSKEFAASYWCRFELAMAHLQLDAKGHRKDSLIVILLDDIPTNLLSPHMTQILTTKTYLPWPRDLPYQQQFWKTLRKSLRKELLYQ